LATFSAALAGGLVANGAEVSVVRVSDGSPTSSKLVVGDLVNNSASSVAASVELLDRSDVVVVQHEYGLYGGPDGDEVLEILDGIDVPSIVIAHTILRNPTPHQRSVLEAVAALASQVVVMSEAARERLCAQFDVDPSTVVTIPHGATGPGRRLPLDLRKRPTMLTWGLIGPGKGIERVIDAMQQLQDLPMRPRYLVAGRTHPKVLASNGESYRDARIEQARRIGVEGSVVFDPAYRDVASLDALIQSCAVVVLPYDSKDQVTSGVLVDAVAAGKPVVATAFPHAVELLAGGAGIVVDHDDPDALALALRRVLTEPGLAERMSVEAARLAPSMAWSVVATAYLDLADRLLSERLALV
jgi:glycosyltransferase involved in cell wall biosynthesis